MGAVVVHKTQTQIEIIEFRTSDGLIFMQTFALTLFKRPARPEPQRTSKVCIRSSPKTPHCRT